jgi:hypothetical protein
LISAKAMKNNPGSNLIVDLEEEQRIEKEAQGLVELHDFIKAHPDAPVKEIAKFMPPVDSRAVNKAIQLIALRDKKNDPKEGT